MNYVIMKDPYGNKVSVSEDIVPKAKLKGYELYDENPQEEYVRLRDTRTNEVVDVNKKIANKALESGKFVIDTPTKKDKEEPIGIGESFLRGALQGATLEFGDEIAGLFNTDLKKQMRSRYAEAEKTHPIATTIGGITGSLVTPGGMLAKAGKTGLKHAIGFGAAEGIGRSNEESAAEGAAIGGALGGATHGVFSGISKLASKFMPENLDKVARESATKALNPSLQSLKKSGFKDPTELGQRALDEGLIQPFDDYRKIGSRALELSKKEGSKISEIEDVVGNAPFSRRKEVAERISEIKVPYKKFSNDFKVIQEIEKDVSNLKKEYVDFFLPLQEKSVKDVFPEIQNIPQLKKELSQIKNVLNRIDLEKQELRDLVQIKRSLEKQISTAQGKNFASEIVDDDVLSLLKRSQVNEITKNVLESKNIPINNKISQLDAQIDVLSKKLSTEIESLKKQAEMFKRLKDPAKIEKLQEKLTKSIDDNLADSSKMFDSMVSKRDKGYDILGKKLDDVDINDLRSQVAKQGRETISENPKFIKQAEALKQQRINELTGDLGNVEQNISKKKDIVSELVRKAKKMGSPESKKNVIDTLSKLEPNVNKKLKDVPEFTSGELGKVFPNIKDKDIKIGDVLQLKRMADDQGIHASKNMVILGNGKRIQLPEVENKVLKEVRKILKGEADLDIQKQFPEVYDDWIKANDKFRTAAGVLGVTEDQLSRDLSRKQFGLSEKLPAYMSFMSGNVLRGMTIAALGKYASEVSNSTIAHVAKSISNAIKKRPEIMDKYLPMLIKAVNNPSKFAVTHASLMALDPTYKQIVDN